MIGFMGKILWVDLSNGKFTEEDVPEDACRKYLGGLGLAAKYLYEKIPKNSEVVGIYHELGDIGIERWKSENIQWEEIFLSCKRIDSVDKSYEELKEEYKKNTISIPYEDGNYRVIVEFESECNSCGRDDHFVISRERR